MLRLFEGGAYSGWRLSKIFEREAPKETDNKRFYIGIGNVFGYFLFATRNSALSSSKLEFIIVKLVNC